MRLRQRADLGMFDNSYNIVVTVLEVGHHNNNLETNCKLLVTIGVLSGDVASRIFCRNGLRQHATMAS